MQNEAKNNNRQISPTGFNLMRETITYNIYVIYENLLLQRICNWSNTTGATSRTESCYPSGVLEFALGF
jgi:hypothetical protein